MARYRLPFNSRRGDERRYMREYMRKYRADRKKEESVRSEHAYDPGKSKPMLLGTDDKEKARGKLLAMAYDAESAESVLKAVGFK